MMYDLSQGHLFLAIYGVRQCGDAVKQRCYNNRFFSFCQTKSHNFQN